jgi:hypothetical protein
MYSEKNLAKLKSQISTNYLKSELYYSVWIYDILYKNTGLVAAIQLAAQGKTYIFSKGI